MPRSSISSDDLPLHQQHSQPGDARQAQQQEPAVAPPPPQQHHDPADAAGHAAALQPAQLPAQPSVLLTSEAGGTPSPSPPHQSHAAAAGSDGSPAGSGSCPASDTAPVSGESAAAATQARAALVPPVLSSVAQLSSALLPSSGSSEAEQIRAIEVAVLAAASALDAAAASGVEQPSASPEQQEPLGYGDEEEQEEEEEEQEEVEEEEHTMLHAAAPPAAAGLDLNTAAAAAQVAPFTQRRLLLHSTATRPGLLPDHPLAPAPAPAPAPLMAAAAGAAGAASGPVRPTLPAHASTYLASTAAPAAPSSSMPPPADRSHGHCAAASLQAFEQPLSQQMTELAAQHCRATALLSAAHLDLQAAHRYNLEQELAQAQAAGTGTGRGPFCGLPGAGLHRYGFVQRSGGLAAALACSSRLGYSRQGYSCHPNHSWAAPAPGPGPSAAAAAALAYGDELCLPPRAASTSPGALPCSPLLPASLPELPGSCVSSVALPPRPHTHPQRMTTTCSTSSSMRAVGMASSPPRQATHPSRGAALHVLHAVHASSPPTFVALPRIRTSRRSPVSPMDAPAAPPAAAPAAAQPTAALPLFRPVPPAPRLSLGWKHDAGVPCQDECTYLNAPAHVLHRTSAACMPHSGLSQHASGVQQLQPALVALVKDTVHASVEAAVGRMGVALQQTVQEAVQVAVQELWEDMVEVMGPVQQQEQAEQQP